MATVCAGSSASLVRGCALLDLHQIPVRTGKAATTRRPRRAFLALRQDARGPHTEYWRPMALLEVRNLTRRFGDFVAVDDVSFDVEAGEFFTLLGPSGCGKTTILRMLAGFDEPDGGQIVLDGKPMTGVAPEQRPIHTVFQSYALFPHLTVAQNAAFPMRVAGRSDAEVVGRVAEVLALVALSDKADAYPHELSGGQKQRVAVARALTDLPRVLLLDEPLGALDAKLREQMQVELIRLQRELGITFVFVTHSQPEALALSHRIAVMNAGRIEQLDEPSHLYGFPRNRFVADFIGHCTLLPARLERVQDDAVELQVEHVGRVLAPRPPRPVPGTPGWLALRPEQVVLGAPGELGHLANRARGSVLGFLYVGDVTTYIVALPDGTRFEALRANSAPGRARFFEAGEPVELAWSERIGSFLDG